MNPNHPKKVFLLSNLTSFLIIIFDLFHLRVDHFSTAPTRNLARGGIGDLDKNRLSLNGGRPGIGISIGTLPTIEMDLLL
jgi:hypothetical protein